MLSHEYQKSINVTLEFQVGYHHPTAEGTEGRKCINVFSRLIERLEVAVTLVFLRTFDQINGTIETTQTGKQKQISLREKFVK